MLYQIQVIMVMSGYWPYVAHIEDVVAVVVVGC
jgi:hypothetical protein